jgi:hypothetical protein
LIRAKRPGRLPIVLTKTEVRKVINHLSGFKKGFAPFVVDTRMDPFSAAKIRNTLLTSKPFKYYTDLLFR